MDMHGQSNVLFPQEAESSDFSAGAPTNRPARSDAAACEPAALISAVRLLTKAGRALNGSNDDARKYIVRAAALLQAESVFREQDAGCAPAATRGRLAPWQVTRVIRFIDANLGEKIGPQDFAALTRLSTNHFAKAFRATIGEAPYAYLIRRRIDRIKQMMLETDLPLAHIALDCGLADQAHMTRHFTRLVGISPGAWRRAHVAALTEWVRRPRHSCRSRESGRNSHQRAPSCPTRYPSPVSTSPAL